jgi:ABC transport system ATP-binding/permease protein
MAIWKLTIEDDEGQKTVVPLVRDEYTVGRRDGHTIRLTERNVSRDHARLKKDSDGYVIEDLGSYNGVFVNGHRLVEGQRLVAGDLILIGDYRIEAHNEEAQARPIPAVVPPTKPSTVPPPTVAAAPQTRAARDQKPHRFVLLSGGDGGREFPLDKPTMTVGRGEEADIRVNHSSVSRMHCEVHSLDNEQFEVIDSDSANGIRVNGQDIKRALLAPGDTLELGDVVLKYIAAGQPFVYDASVAEAYRDVGVGERRRGGVALWGILIVCIGGAIIGGVVLAKNAGSDERGAARSTAPTGTPPAEDVLAKPYKLKQDGDVMGAHDGVLTITKDSPLRKDPRYIEIENAWADKTIATVKDEESIDKKRAILKTVLQSGAEESYRTTAADMLGELDKGFDGGTVAPPPTHTAVPPTATTAPKPPPTVTAPPTATTAKPPPTATTATATAKPTATAPTPTPGQCGSYKGDYSAAMRAKDFECVRSMLLPRLNSGSISQPEARYLKAACNALGDHACEKRAAEKL